MRMNAYAVAIAASIAKIIASVNASMIGIPALALALAKEPRGAARMTIQKFLNKVFEISNSPKNRPFSVVLSK